MTTINRTYAIIGTGAVGAFYGAKLQLAGFQVHFLLHNDYHHVLAHGLNIKSSEGDLLLPHVNAYEDPRLMPRCDVVVVSLKTTHNKALPDILPHVLKDDGVVVVLQNGLGVEEEIAKIVGSRMVMGGLCFLRSNKIGPGLLRHTGSGYVILGDYISNGGAGISPRCRAIAEDFNRAGVVVKLTEDLAVARWQKLVWNIPYNGLSVVLNAMTDRLMQCSCTRTLIMNLMREVEAAATSCGHAIPPTFVREMFEYTEKMEPYTTSMKLDFDAKKTMEIESIYGNPLRAGINAGASMPRIEMLYQQLKMLDEFSLG